MLRQQPANISETASLAATATMRQQTADVEGSPAKGQLHVVLATSVDFCHIIDAAGQLKTPELHPVVTDSS
jgi:hypothetical protein